jgi:hypothetical protein
MTTSRCESSLRRRRAADHPAAEDCAQCNWPQGGAPGPIAISTCEGIGDSGKQILISNQHTIEALGDLSALRLTRAWRRILRHRSPRATLGVMPVGGAIRDRTTTRSPRVASRPPSLFERRQKTRKTRCPAFLWNSSAVARVTSLCRLRTAAFSRALPPEKVQWLTKKLRH